ncbi:hypothetical protein [Geothrix oryzisoli]|uniref:hypothetical protein n=1 Tax=Geothrix oryzisoli TaxID=2922721 RepID=UPI001FAB566F|nr:hypothetical protein [Geothrix oryzisoli]
MCFDIIDKIRELSIAGDTEAEKQAEELEKIRKEGDISRALRFEKDLLVLARDRFELLSPIEFIDLERLQTDRNRCAHPSLVAEDQAYAPSAELARAHIHSAVTHLLQHPPAQGKYALQRLTNEVDSEYFPTKESQAIIAFSSGPLRKPRESLVRNFTIVLIKKMVKEDLDYKQRYKITAALSAISKMHPGHYHNTIASKLSHLIRALDDTELIRAIHLLTFGVPDCWGNLELDIQQRLQNYVKMLPSDTFEEIEGILSFEPLRAIAEERVNRATRDDFKNTYFFELPGQIADRLIDLYLSSRSFDQANALGKQLMMNASDLTPVHIHRILEGVQNNSEVRYSFELNPLITSIRARKQIPESELDDLLASNGLSEFVSVGSQDA